MPLQDSVLRWVRKHQKAAPVRLLKPVARKVLLTMWSKRAVSFYRQFVGPGDLVFDVGAHKGDKAEMLLKCGGRVVCFEPQPACADVISERFGERVEVVRKGLGAAEGSLRLYVCSAAPVIATFSADWKEQAFSDYDYDQEIDVPVTTLDREIEQRGLPQYLKIDVEGFEAEVLRGLSGRPAYVSIEWSRALLGNTLEALDLLVNLGYREFNVVGGETLRFVMPEWTDVEAVRRYIQQPGQDLPWHGGDIYARAS
jgi:FkbM family methyltransferase